MVTKDQITIFDMGVNEAEVTALWSNSHGTIDGNGGCQEHKRPKGESLTGGFISLSGDRRSTYDADDEELREKFPEGYTALPDEVYKKLEVKPATFIVRTPLRYKGKNGKIVRANIPKKCFPIASPRHRL